VALEFRFARLDEYSRISAFLDEFWARNHVYCRQRDLFDWTFRRSEQWPSDTYSFALAEDSGALAGILGGIPFEFNRFGAASQGVWIVNYVISPNHRKGSAALQLLSQFRRPEFNPVIAFGINPATSAIYRVLRGTVLDEIPRHFLVLPGAEDRMAGLLGIACPDWPAGRARDMADHFVMRGVSERDPESEALIPRSWDEEEWPAIAERTIGASRNSAYLAWRYRKHPLFEYRFIAVREGALSGLAVWRLETIRRQTPEGRADVDRIGRLVEFLPVSIANGEALMSAFAHELREAGAFGADFYGYHGQTRCMLRQFGFRETASHPEGNAIPTRFQPLDGKGGAILSAMFLQSEAPACADAGDCPWYWTKSDSDQDRPN
jgi:hypothetical protein